MLGQYMAIGRSCLSFQSLPITVSTSWKLGDTVNGVAIWENFRFSSESDNGVIACQAIIQSPAEVSNAELF